MNRSESIYRPLMNNGNWLTAVGVVRLPFETMLLLFFFFQFFFLLLLLLLLGWGGCVQQQQRQQQQQEAITSLAGRHFMDLTGRPVIKETDAIICQICCFLVYQFSVIGPVPRDFSSLLTSENWKLSRAFSCPPTTTTTTTFNFCRWIDWKLDTLKLAPRANRWLLK